MYSKLIHPIHSRKLLLFLGLFSSLLLNAYFAQAQSVITLSEAIHHGLNNKKELKASHLNKSLSQFQTKALYRNYGPQVSIDYTYHYNPILQTSVLPIGVFNPNYPADATKNVQFGTKWTQSAGITINQPILDFNLKQQIKESKLQEKITNWSQEILDQDLAYAIAQSYLSIYLQEASIKTLYADTQRTFLSKKLLQQTFDEHRLLKTDLNQAIINHNNVLQQLNDGQMQLIQFKVDLLYLMGAPAEISFQFSIDTSFINQWKPLLDSSLLNLSQPAIQQLLVREQLAELQMQSIQRKRLPSLRFKGYLGANQYSQEFNPLASNSWFGLSYLGLEMNLPLLLNENSQNKKQQLQLQINQYKLLIEDNQAVNQKAQVEALLKIANIKTQLKTQLENLTLSKESITIYQIRVKEGLESSSKLNLEEANLQALEAAYEKSRISLWTYWLDYLQGAGQLVSLWN